jgi:hypothetical protein
VERKGKKKKGVKARENISSKMTWIVIAKTTSRHIDEHIETPERCTHSTLSPSLVRLLLDRRFRRRRSTNRNRRRRRSGSTLPLCGSHFTPFFLLLPLLNLHTSQHISRRGEGGGGGKAHLMPRPQRAERIKEAHILKQIWI